MDCDITRDRHKPLVISTPVLKSGPYLATWCSEAIVRYELQDDKGSSLSKASSNRRDRRNCLVLNWEKAAYGEISLVINELRHAGLCAWVWPSSIFGYFEDAARSYTRKNDPYHGEAGDVCFGSVVKAKPLIFPDRRWSLFKHNAAHYCQVSAIEMFRSIYILRKLSHPNIGNMLCLYAENPDVQAFDTFYAILDYDGLTLRNVLDHEHPLSIRCVLEIVTQTVVGLAYIHSFAVAHGELNPSSLILVNRRSNRVHASGNPKWKSFLLKITGFGKYPLISMDQTQDVDDAAKAYRAPEVITQWSTFKLKVMPALSTSSASG